MSNLLVSRFPEGKGARSGRVGRGRDGAVSWTFIAAAPSRDGGDFQPSSSVFRGKQIRNQSSDMIGATSWQCPCVHFHQPTPRSHVQAALQLRRAFQRGNTDDYIFSITLQLASAVMGDLRSAYWDPPSLFESRVMGVRRSAESEAVMRNSWLPEYHRPQQGEWWYQGFWMQSGGSFKKS